MNLDVAAKIGLGLLKHHDEVGKLLGGAGKLLGGEGVGKLADRFAGTLANRLDRIQDRNGPVDGLNSINALKGFAHFDADKNGKLSKEELTEGLQKLEAAGLTLPQDQQLHALGTQLLKNYEKAAALDGQAESVSYLDMGLLIGKDNRATHLSAADWQSLNA